MTYKDEQINYAEELKEITLAIGRLDEIFEDSSQTDVKILEYYKRLYPSRFQLSSTFEIQQQVILFRRLLEEDYRRKTARKKELERLLSQTPAERTKDNIKNNIGKTAEYLASITPQHVSGRVYKVENGDGCGMFCLWFVIIDAIIIGIIYLCTEL
jgi:hypothetical protein